MSASFDTGAFGLILGVFRERVNHIPAELHEKQAVLSEGLERFRRYFDKIVNDHGLKLGVMSDLIYVAIPPVAAWLLKEEGKYEFNGEKELETILEISRNSKILQYHYDNFDDFNFREVDKFEDLGFCQGAEKFIGDERKWKDAINKPDLQTRKLVNETKLYIFDIPADCPKDYMLSGFSSLSGRNLYAWSGRSDGRVWKIIERELALNSISYNSNVEITTQFPSLLSPFLKRGIGAPSYVTGGQLYDNIFYGRKFGNLPFHWEKVNGEKRVERF